ncbi:regulator [Rhodobacteraceae bacterium RKSG542]|uniref:regulator n=1 Tax=Pseudovibrio flavus TaxID=2529854 RepID=UPI0012BBABCA|nr:regulator [Pseudovibrio flavus]MTI15697.1 regulator [Pseudovibrio flavus]
MTQENERKLSDLIDNGEEPIVYVIVGRGWEEDEGEAEDAIPFNIILTAVDDDSAIRRSLEALGEQGYASAELDQIGLVTEEPDEPTLADAYRDALAGNVAIISFKEG